MHKLMYACMGGLMHVCMHAWVNDGEGTFLVAYTYIYIHIHVCIQIHTDTYVYMHTYIHTYMPACVHAYISVVSICVVSMFCVYT